MIRRVAALDCGTNSLRLLVADLDLDRGTLTDVERRMEIVRLGQGVDTTGRLAPEALDRTMNALSDFAGVITREGAEAVRMVATSATRDASNSEEFVRRVKEVLGAGPEVLSGDEEARLSFTGATAELAGDRSVPPPYLVVDIGGGSTEFVLGGPGGPGGGGAGSADGAGKPAGGQAGGAAALSEVTSAISVDIGCVRMTERHLCSDPPGRGEVAAATADIDAAIERAAGRVPAGQARTLVGLAGSVTTVAGIALDLPAYDAARLHHARIPAAQVHEVTARLLAMTRAERAVIGVMHPGRVDVIGAGALILDRIMTRLGFAEVLVSEHDILDGIAWSIARPPSAAST
jgi:exopolyphosphatase / guanosine-5'-triphosphate,3'-diphosphate pyrophosphatase